MRQLLTVICIVFCFVTNAMGEVTDAEKAQVLEIRATVKKAGAEYVAGNLDAAGDHIRTAISQIKVAGKDCSPEVYAGLESSINSVKKARALLELQGVSVPPFVPPRKPTAKAAEKPMAKPAPKPTVRPPRTSSVRSIPPKPATPDPNAISFTKQVAPILSQRCGRCHIQGSRGNFNLGTFAKLMKGPPEGVVVFPGDTIGSRLIETIETGDMPRGGKISPQEFAVLKGWVKQGAKFDGTDPNGSITGGPAPAGDSDKPKEPEIKMATGKETVSFARDVAPLLIGNCNGCHIDAMRVRGGLNMDNFTRLMQGGDTGNVITPGKSMDSLLIKKLKGVGIEGEKMPAGGRPALSDKDIQLISTWIDEGATFDGDSPTQPLGVMAQLAWAANATADQMNNKRQGIAEQNMKLVSASGAQPVTIETDHFFITGTSDPATIKLVGEKAESHMSTIQTVAKGGNGDEFFHGKATLFVLPRRYDYSEFAKMVEKRQIPSAWTSHWRFDGIDAYAAIVATDRDEEDVIASRLLSPLTSLAVATRGGSVPRWFAEGVGSAIANRKPIKDREEKMRREQLLYEAVAACENAKSFFGKKLSPEQSDRLAGAMAATMLDRKNRKNFDACMRAVSEGTPFASAFANAFRMPVNGWVDNWLKWSRGARR